MGRGGSFCPFQVARSGENRTFSGNNARAVRLRDQAHIVNTPRRISWSTLKRPCVASDTLAKALRVRCWSWGETENTDKNYHQFSDP